MSNAANLGSGGLKPLRLGSLRGLMEQANARCTGEHDVYVADTIIAPSEGTVTVITVCRSCDRVSFHTKQITEPHKGMNSTKENKP
jgi:hypothetical protein